LTEFGAQRFQNGAGAGHFHPAQLQPFKLVKQIAARVRRQLLQKLRNPIGLLHDTQFSCNSSVEAFARS
jgi:hypothetical protein